MVQRYAKEVKDTALRCILKIRDTCEAHIDIQTCGQFRQHCHCIVHILGMEKKTMARSNQHTVHFKLSVRDKQQGYTV